MRKSVQVKKEGNNKITKLILHFDFERLKVLP